MLFLLTVIGMYFAIGVALALGASALLEVFHSVQHTNAFLIGQLIIGVVLTLVSHKMDKKPTSQQVGSGPGRISQWRERAMGSGQASTSLLLGVMAFAVAAVLTEVATMVPYLGAIGIITTNGPGWPGNAALLAGYCVVMILPALVLTLG